MKVRLTGLLGAGMLACTPPPADAPAPAGTPTPPTSSESVDPDAWRRLPPAAGPQSVFSYPAPHMARLANGLTILLVPRPVGTISLQLVSRQGSSSDPTGASGRAALATRMLTEGTRRKSALDLAIAAERLGSQLNDDAGRDNSSVGLEVLTEDVSAAVALLAEVVREPAFRAPDVERVRAEWVDGLIAERQDPRRLASLAGMRALLGPIAGASVSGTPGSIAALTPADLAHFHREAFTPGACALVLVGDITLERAQALAEQSFGTWQPPPRPRAATTPVAPQGVEAPAQRLLLIDRPGSTQSALFVAQRFPERLAKGHEARQLMSDAIGGLFTSRLNSELRERRGYTYGAASYAIATRQWGAFVVMTSVRTDATAPALDALLGELRAVRPGGARPLLDEELTRAKADLVQHLGANLEHVGRVAGDLAVQFVQGLPSDYDHRFASLIEAVSLANVHSAATELTPETLLTVIVGDVGVIEPELRRAGYAPSAAPAELTE